MKHYCLRVSIAVSYQCGGYLLDPVSCTTLQTFDRRVNPVSVKGFNLLVSFRCAASFQNSQVTCRHLTGSRCCRLAPGLRILHRHLLLCFLGCCVCFI